MVISIFYYWINNHSYLFDVDLYYQVDFYVQMVCTILSPYLLTFIWHCVSADLKDDKEVCIRYKRRS